MYNLDHKPFPIEIGHLMPLFKIIFFVRPCMGVLQTDEIFSQAPFGLVGVAGKGGIIGGWEMVLSWALGTNCDLQLVDLVERNLFTRQRSTSF